MAKLILNNFLGLAPAGNTRSNLKSGESWQVANSIAIDLIRSPGISSQGLSSGGDVDQNNKLTALINKGIHYDNGTNSYLYMIEHSNKLHEIDSLATGQVDALANFPVSIAADGVHASHTTMICEDIINFKVNRSSTGVNSLFVSYRDNTDGDIMRVDPDGTNLDSDYFSGSAGGAALSKNPHPLIVAENGFGYVGDGNTIHKLDPETGANGTATLSVIDVPVGWTITDMIDHQGLDWIVGINDPNYLSSSGLRPGKLAKVFVWNYIRNSSTDFSGWEKGSPLSLGSIAKPGNIFIHSDGNMYIFILSENYKTQIRILNGNTFETLWEEPGDFMPTKKGSISSYHGHIMWTDSSGTIHTFKYPEKMYNKIGKLSNSAGAIMLDSSGNYLLSNNNLELNIHASNYTDSSLTLLVKEFPKLSIITGMTVFYKPVSDTTANNNINISAYKDFSGTPISGTCQISHAADGARGYKYFALGGKNWSNINALRLIFTWTLTSGNIGMIELYRIEIEYEPISKKK